MNQPGSHLSPEGPGTSDGRRGELTPAAIARSLGAIRLSKYSGLVLLGVFIVLFALWVPETFLTTTTAQAIAGDQAITVVLALGAILTISTGQFDISLAQTLGTGTIVCLALMTHGYSQLEAVLATVIFGVLVGAANAFLVVKLRIESLIATLGTSSILLAISAIVSGGSYVGPAPDSFQNIASWQPLGVPILVVWALLAAAIVWWVLEHTPAGRKVYATGANPETARLSGIPVGKYIVGSLICSGILAGLAAVLLAAKLGTTSSEIGPAYLLPTFAAVFLSTTQIKPGRFNVWGTVIALYLLATGVKGFELVGGEAWITNMFNGVALIGAVGLSVWLQRRSAARAA